MDITNDIIDVINTQKKSMTNLEQTLSGTTPEQNLIRMMGLEVNPQSLKEKFLLATFQIIAENGADALSANELIKKTNSSKGALFHHFKTLDDLCLESLNYLRNQMRVGLKQTDHSNLKSFLHAYVQDVCERQGSKSYFHITHFFRDRALKDERFRVALNELYETYTKAFVSEFSKYLPENTNQGQIRESIIFTYLTLERLSFRKLTASNPVQVDDMIDWFIEAIEARFKSFQA